MVVARECCEGGQRVLCGLLWPVLLDVDSGCCEWLPLCSLSFMGISVFVLE